MRWFFRQFKKTALGTFYTFEGHLMAYIKVCIFLKMFGQRAKIIKKLFTFDYDENKSQRRID